MKFALCGTSSVDNYTTWPKNDPNAVRLIFTNSCCLVYVRTYLTMYSIEVMLYAFYDGLGPQYATPVIYADDNGVPGVKLTINEPVVDLTCQSSADNRWITVTVPIKNRRINPGYQWVGIYSQSFRPCFNYPSVYSDGIPYYTMNAPDGYLPPIGSAVTVHPVGPIDVTGVFFFDDAPIPIDFMYEVLSELHNNDSIANRRDILRRNSTIITIIEAYIRRSRFYKKIIQSVKLKENKRGIRFLHRFVTTIKRIRDFPLFELLRIKIEKIIFSPLTLIRLVRENILNTVYKNQTALRLIVDTAIELGSGDVCEIRYCKPDGVTGSFPASILNENSSLIYHDITSETELDVSGWWKFWAYITFTDGRSACGKAVKIFIADEGS